MSNEDYLWNREGTPDPDVERLESLLGRYRYRPSAPRAGYRRVRFFLAAVAAAAVLLISGLFIIIDHRGASYEVVSLRGRPTIRSQAVLGSGGRAWAGDAVETDANARARLLVGSLGEVVVFEDSLVEIVDCGETNHRLELERGTIRASISAEPRLFQVGTPAAIAVDLGCVYRLSVDTAKNTFLQVETGRVSLEIQGRKVFVPAGAVCRADPDRGPGIPLWSDSPGALNDAVAVLEKGEGDVDQNLSACLDAATGHDTLTLWHLFGVADEKGRGAVYERLSKISPPPEGVTREKCIALDSDALLSWKDALAEAWGPW